MDIGSESGYHSCFFLSNFAPHYFIFDGVECFSMEGFLQSLKFKDPDAQAAVCRLVGIEAKRQGQRRNKAWKQVQKLWWKGKEFDREGEEYQTLLDRAFDALAQSVSFRAALLATESAVLTHRIGKTNPRDTVLTQSEFCSRLTRLRDRLQIRQRRTA